jgi:hypothetical protein
MPSKHPPAMRRNEGLLALATERKIMSQRIPIGPTATSAQRKDDIDSGRTGDKTAGFEAGRRSLRAP